MNTEPFLIAMAVSFGLIILASFTGGVLRSRFKITIKQLGPTWPLVIKLFYLILFGVIGFCLVPLVLHFFFSMQVEIDNDDLVLIKWLAANEPQMVYGLWALFVAGLVIALPAVIKGSLFR